MGLVPPRTTLKRKLIVRRGNQGSCVQNSTLSGVGAFKTEHTLESLVRQLVVQHNIQQRRVNLHIAVVFDEAQFAEFIHKSAYSDEV